VPELLFKKRVAIINNQRVAVIPYRLNLRNGRLPCTAIIIDGKIAVASQLVPEIGSFLQQYQNLTTNSSLDKYVKEAIM